MELIHFGNLKNITENNTLISEISNLYVCTFNEKKYIYKKADFFKKKQYGLFNKLSNIENNHLILPQYIIKNSFRPVGYLTEYLENYNSLFNIVADKKNINRIKLLKIIKDAIIEMHKTGIIHCDLHSANIMYKDYDVKIIDFDFSSFNYSEPNGLNDFAKQYLEHNPLDISLDIYLFNITTMSVLYDIPFFDVFNLEYVIYGYMEEKEQIEAWQKTKQKKELTYDDFLINYY